MSSYNGWSNWETWNCNLWYDGAFAEEARTETAESLADIIEDAVREDELANIPHSGLARDLLEQSLDEIDWLEIAEAYIENYGNEEDGEEADDDEDTGD